MPQDRPAEPQAETSAEPGSRPEDPVARAPTAELSRFIAAAFEQVGLPPEDAAEVAELMTETDLTGADAHGVFRLPQYIRRIQAGGVNPKPNIEVRQTGPATALVDGDNGMGHLVMARAAEEAVSLARETGVAWVGARRSNHAGSAGLYAEMPVKHGMVGIYSAVASANHMAPWGGSESLLGTNPLAIAIPCGDAPPVVLDMATTIVSYGTVKSYALHGRTMPPDWLVSRVDGKPLTDPRRSHEGVLLPIGGHKGSGLALVLGLLGGPLNRAAFGRDVIDFNADQSGESNTGHFIVALDVSRFLPPEAFAAEVNRQLDDLRNSERLPGAGTIRMPGDQRGVRRKERRENGIPIPEPLQAQLDTLAKTLGIAPLRTERGRARQQPAAK
jgi:LDH2 family malate/lactate/ureidoglycolate dehydrogenase